MQKPRLEAWSASLPSPALPRRLFRAATHPYVTSAAGVVLLLVAIVTDVAAHAGSLAFFVLCVLYWRRPRSPARLIRDSEV